MQVAREDLIGRGEEKKNRRKKHNKTVNNNKTSPKREKFLDSDIFLSESFLKRVSFGGGSKKKPTAEAGDCYRFARVRRGTGIDRSRLEVEWRFFQF